MQTEIHAENTNPVFISDENDDNLTRPSSRAESTVSREFSLPGYVANDSGEDEPPPPQYNDCTIPPPIYEDLYPVQTPASSRGTKTFMSRDKMIKVIMCVGLGALAVSLLAIGIKNMIIGGCEGIPFLLIWCLVSGTLIIFGLCIALSKNARDKINKWTSLKPILVYFFAVFGLAWLIAGSVISWQLIRDATDCSSEVITVTFVSCVFGFIFGTCFFCFRLI